MMPPRMTNNPASATRPPPDAAGATFCTTRWTEVLAARGSSPAARQALSELCAAYYEPVVSFLAWSGHDAVEAREVAHEFFAWLLAGDRLANVRRGEGRFRSYLLGAVKHFLCHRNARERRYKRGGGLEAFPLDTGTDTSPSLGLPDTRVPSPDLAFDREWAAALLNRALKALRREYEAEGKTAQFDQLKPWLAGEAGHGDQAELARGLGLESTAFKSAVHRLKRRFRHLVKQEITLTLSDPGGVEEEMRALFAALSR
jgi:RNA polymerase sigma-70 factor (ECF subfamily)